MWRYSYWGVGVLLLAGTVWAQTVHVVDNNLNAPDGDNVYATVQEAVDAAEQGDIVHIVPSPTDYDLVNVDKRLSIYGGGMELDPNAPRSSTVPRITFLPASGQLDPSGSLVSGLNTSIISGNVAVNDAQVLNCYLKGVFGAQALQVVGDNITVNSCIIDDDETFSTQTGTNAVVSNNVFAGSVLIDDGIVSNNLFIRADDTAHRVGFDDCLVANNIFYGISPTGNAPASGIPSERSVFSNNLAFASLDDALPPPEGDNTGVNNIAGQNPLFVNVPAAGVNAITADLDFHLQDESPAKGAGTDGTDLGIFGGTKPFSLETALPAVESFEIINPLVPQGTDLNVSVRAKAN